MEFDWDDGNREKNLHHGVHDWEIEEALMDPRRVYAGSVSVRGERKRVLLGRAVTSGKYLRIVISAVEMSDAERRRYRQG